MWQLVAAVRSCYAPVLIILSPPRSGSTALARAFWQHSDFRWYVHEPFDRMYHYASDEHTVEAALAAPVDLHRIRTPTHGQGLIIKEMTFQVGRHAVDLLAAATMPVVVTVRDPRLSICSRARRRLADNQPPSFPRAETGWPDLRSIIAVMRAEGTRYLIVETTELRRRPRDVVSDLCRHLGTAFQDTMLSWNATPDTPLGQLGGEQQHWYEAVLSSTGFADSDEPIPDPRWLPEAMHGFVAEDVATYQQILAEEYVIGSSR